MSQKDARVTATKGKLTRLSPDAEPSNVSTRSQLQQVELLHTDGVHTRNVTESPGQPLVLVIDDEGPTTLDATTVTHLTLAGAEPLALVHLLSNLLLMSVSVM